MLIKNALYWITWFCVFFALFFLIKTYGFAVYIVSGSSMEPTLKNDERLFVNKMVYRFFSPQRGEIVVFQANQKEQYIKRVLALPGETIEVIGDTVLINGKPHKEPYLEAVITQRNAQNEAYNIKDSPKFTVQKDHVFVLGDNRPHSTDSRDLGEIPYSKIVGRADAAIWPLDQIGGLNHAYEP